MSLRGPTNKFFYDRVHDQYLYYLTLEAAMYDEGIGDLVFTPSGQIKMKGGWSAIAKQMTRVFGRTFTAQQVNRRYTAFTSEDGYLDQIFEDVSELQDQIRFLTSVMES